MNLQELKNNMGIEEGQTLELIELCDILHIEYDCALIENNLYDNDKCGALSDSLDLINVWFDIKGEYTGENTKITITEIEEL